MLVGVVILVRIVMLVGIMMLLGDRDNATKDIKVVLLAWMVMHYCSS